MHCVAIAAVAIALQVCATAIRVTETSSDHRMAMAWPVLGEIADMWSPPLLRIMLSQRVPGPCLARVTEYATRRTMLTIAIVKRDSLAVIAANELVPLANHGSRIRVGTTRLTIDTRNALTCNNNSNNRTMTMVMLF
jgi:hypothetical protein